MTLLLVFSINWKPIFFSVHKNTVEIPTSIYSFKFAHCAASLTTKRTETDVADDDKQKRWTKTMKWKFLELKRKQSFVTYKQQQQRHQWQQQQTTTPPQCKNKTKPNYTKRQPTHINCKYETTIITFTKDSRILREG